MCSIPLNPYFMEMRSLELGNYARLVFKPLRWHLQPRPPHQRRSEVKRQSLLYIVTVYVSFILFMAASNYNTVNMFARHCLKKKKHQACAVRFEPTLNLFRSSGEEKRLCHFPRLLQSKSAMQTGQVAATALSGHLF